MSTYRFLFVSIFAFSTLAQAGTLAKYTSEIKPDGFNQTYLVNVTVDAQSSIAGTSNSFEMKGSNTIDDVPMDYDVCETDLVLSPPGAVTITVKNEATGETVTKSLGWNGPTLRTNEPMRADCSTKPTSLAGTKVTLPAIAFDDETPNDQNSLHFGPQGKYVLEIYLQQQTLNTVLTGGDRGSYSAELQLGEAEFSYNFFDTKALTQATKEYTALKRVQ